MSGPEFGHRLKINRAVHHLQQLEAHGRAWIESNRHLSDVVPDPDGSEYSLIIAIVDDVPGDPFSLLISDVVQNVRSALDHLAFLLAGTFTSPLPEDLARDSQFPIVGNENSKGGPAEGRQIFSTNVKRWLGGIDPRAQGVIERLQPFQAGSAYRQHPLWRLQRLSNIDKHRLLHAAGSVADGFIIRHVDLINSNMQIRPNTTPQVFRAFVKRDTVVARIAFEPIDPSKEMKVKVELPLFIAFADGIDAQRNVVATLVELYNFAVNEVIQPLEAFL